MTNTTHQYIEKQRISKENEYLKMTTIQPIFLYGWECWATQK